MAKIISIIIPVYNVGTVLRDTLNSIVSQSYMSKCEIILVNDGSTDDSGLILDEYSYRYNNITVFHKKNEGVSTTRNKGLELATGEYVLFVDADDILHPDALEIIIENLERSKPDILAWNFKTFYRKLKFNKILAPDPKSIGKAQSAFNYLSLKGSAVGLYSKAIRRSIIQKGIRFDSTMSFGEDMFFSWKCFLLSEKVEYLDTHLYYYRQDRKSAVYRFHANLFEKYDQAFDNIEEFARQYGILTDEIRQDIDYHFACRLPSLTTMEYRAPYTKAKKLEKLKTIINNKRISRALQNDNRLNFPLAILAKTGKPKKMISFAKKRELISRLLFPIKKLLK